MCSTAIVLVLLPDLVRPAVSAACETPRAEPVASICMPAILEPTHLPERDFPFVMVTGASVTVSGSFGSGASVTSSLRAISL